LFADNPPSAVFFAFLDNPTAMLIVAAPKITAKIIIETNSTPPFLLKI